ncbi:MAG: B12-binding domain-containing radical SAM protein [Rudaea sp.]
MTTNGHRSRSHGQALRVGILDLAARQSDGSLYARVANPNQASIMPQVIAVWAEEMGHEVSYHVYTGLDNLLDSIDLDVDILFVSSFTQSAYLAYSVSGFFRQRNVITVLGGPHARAYARDACHYFDYVVEIADKALIQELLQDPAPNPDGGLALSARAQPRALPGVRERWKYIRQVLDRALLIRVVPMIGSLGCPYTCAYCIDSEVRFQPLPYDQIREDLLFLQQQAHPPVILWSDPNFGVRFDEYMDLIESTVKPGTLQFSAESSLSLLNEQHLQRLRTNHFLGIAPGIESWFDFNDKSKAGKRVGMDKVNAVAEQVRLITEYIPYVQTNFIFGLDSDTGAIPFELTKRFIDLAPGAYPNYALITAFGDSAPLSRDLHAQGRVIDIPFPFLDGASMFNVRLKNYSIVEFYDYLIDLVKYTFSPRVTWRRFKANDHLLPKFGNALRGLIGSEKGRPVAGHSWMRNEFATNSHLQDFYCGKSSKPPAFFQARIKAGLGPLYEYLPPAVMHHLEHGEDALNPGIPRLRDNVRTDWNGSALAPLE